jgi:hypothetical protein
MKFNRSSLTADKCNVILDTQNFERRAYEKISMFYYSQHYYSDNNFGIHD